MSVSEPSEVPGQGAFVEVRFAGTHDYQIVPGEKEQKFVPGWTLRLHRGYARFILGRAVKDVSRDSKK
jgi:hypothetical protein